MQRCVEERSRLGCPSAVGHQIGTRELLFAESRVDPASWDTGLVEERSGLIDVDGAKRAV